VTAINRIVRRKQKLWLAQTKDLVPDPPRKDHKLRPPKLRAATIPKPQGATIPKPQAATILKLQAAAILKLQAATILKLQAPTILKLQAPTIPKLRVAAVMVARIVPYKPDCPHERGVRAGDRQRSLTPSTQHRPTFSTWMWHPTQ
jgi:hypothetical protein